MTTPTVIETRRAGQTNERVELARYTISGGEHVIYAQRVLGVVRLVDEPAPVSYTHLTLPTTPYV